MIIPVPSAVSPLNLRFDMMSTRPGSTFFRTAATLSGAAEAPLPDALSCGPGTSLEETPAPAAGAGLWPPNATVAPAPTPAASAATAK